MATTDELIALSNDGAFRQRVRNLVLLEAAGVYAENAGVTNHNTRVAYAFKLFTNPSLAEQVADFLVARTNVLASAVTYDFGRKAVVTDASDAAIRSQIATDWNMLAGV